MILYSVARRQGAPRKKAVSIETAFLMFFTILLYAIMPFWHVDAPSHILPSAYSVCCADKSVS